MTHSFACPHPGYRGWRWSVTVARAARSRVVTIDEVVLLPGEGALLASPWVPWAERIQPRDVTPGVLLPSSAMIRGWSRATPAVRMPRTPNRPS